jgi:large subunit ribosomal protein L23
MAILDIFKKKKIKKEKITKPVKKEKPKKEIKPPEKPKQVKKKELREELPVLEKKPKERKFKESHLILKAPQITEKATRLAEQNQYVFKVYSRANKAGVKKAIESLYGVDVKSIKIVKVPAKKRKVGRQSGWRKGYKKAIIKLREGQKIEILPR